MKMFKHSGRVHVVWKQIYVYGNRNSHTYISLLPEANFGIWGFSLPMCVSLYVFLYVCPCVRQSQVCLRDNSETFKPGSPDLGFVEQVTVTFKVRLNLKVKIYLILSVWVCPPNKSPPIEVRIFKFGPKMYLSIVKVPVDLGIDWPWSSV